MGVAHPAGSAAQELKRISCSYILLLATPHLSLAFRKLEKRRGFFVNRSFLSHCRRADGGVEDLEAVEGSLVQLLEPMHPAQITEQAVAGVDPRLLVAPRSDFAERAHRFVI